MALSTTTKVGLALQSSYTTIPTSATIAVPVDPPTFNLIFDAINDTAVRGAPVVDYDVYAGVKRVEATVDGPFYPEETGYFLKSLMGSEVFTASTTALSATHVFTGFSQPSAVSFFVEDSINASPNSLRYESMLCSSFGLKWSAAAGIVTFTSSWTGRNKTTYSVANPAFGSNLKPWLGWQSTSATLSGATGTWGGQLLDFEITINRAPSLLYTMNSTQFAQRGDAGPFEVTGRFTLDHQSVTDYADYDSNNEINLTMAVARGATTTLEKLAINIPRMHLIEAPLEIQRNNVSLAVQMSFRAAGDTVSLNAPLKFTLNNLKNTAYP